MPACLDSWGNIYKLHPIWQWFKLICVPIVEHIRLWLFGNATIIQNVISSREIIYNNNCKAHNKAYKVWNSNISQQFSKLFDYIFIITAQEASTLVHEWLTRPYAQLNSTVMTLEGNNYWFTCAIIANNTDTSFRRRSDTYVLSLLLGKGFFPQTAAPGMHVVQRRLGSGYIVFFFFLISIILRMRSMIKRQTHSTPPSCWTNVGVYLVPTPTNMIHCWQPLWTSKHLCTVQIYWVL